MKEGVYSLRSGSLIKTSLVCILYIFSAFIPDFRKEFELREYLVILSVGSKDPMSQNVVDIDRAI